MGGFRHQLLNMVRDAHAAITDCYAVQVEMRDRAADAECFCPSDYTQIALGQNGMHTIYGICSADSALYLDGMSPSGLWCIPLGNPLTHIRHCKDNTRPSTAGVTQSALRPVLLRPPYPPSSSPSLKMPVGKALVVNEHGGVDRLTLVPDFSFDDTPKAGEVLVHVAATSVNPVDTYVRSGMYPAKSFPLVRQQHVVAASCGAP
jgi:hypothetical protein